MKGPLDIIQLVTGHSRVGAWVLDLSGGAPTRLWGSSQYWWHRARGTTAGSPSATEAGSFLPTVGPCGGLGLHTFELEEVLV